MIIVLVFILVVVLWAVVIYNSFATMRERIVEAWADIDVQLKRRFDLIPNLVEAVKGYASHEEGVFEKVTQARSALMSAEKSGDVTSIASAEGLFTGAMKSLFAVAEAYPDLKANENFMELQKELSDTENKIQSARRFYNTTVKDYNTRRLLFPASVIARAFSFEEKPYYDLSGSESERENVKVSF